MQLLIDEQQTWPTGAAIANQLERAGYHVTVPQGWVFMFGDQRTIDGCEQAVIRIDDAADPPRTGSGPVALHVVGRADDDIVSLSVSRRPRCDP